MEAVPQKGQCLFLPSFPRDVHVSAFDLARGFLTYLPDASRLKEWAFVMEALPGEFDVGSHPAGETVLDALWSASFGEPLCEDQIAVLEELGREEAGQP
jgi:hypothetical protein